MNPVAIVQARMGSSRFPGKVMKSLAGHPMLWHIVKRLQSVPGLNVVVAVPDLDRDEPIREFCRESQIPFFAGSETDVLDRFYQAACTYNADPIIRVTADCPLVDPGLVSRILELYKAGSYEYVAVAAGATGFLSKLRFPDGLDAECLSMRALTDAWNRATIPSDREHVTPYVWRNKELFKSALLESSDDYEHLRLTVDYPDDFVVIETLYNALYKPDSHFVFADVISYLQQHPQLAQVNAALRPSEKKASLWKMKPDDSQ
jgi:spore coat polysaccharide biosynthesis protein SpsF